MREKTSVVFRYVPLFMIILCGCRQGSQKKQSSDQVTKLLQNSINQVDSLGSERTIHFLDSTLGNIPLSDLDKYNIYSIKYNYFRDQARNFPKSLLYADSMLMCITNHEEWDSSKIFNAYLTKGDAHYVIEEYEKAFYYYHKALELASHYSSVCLKAQYLSRIAMSNYKEERYLYAARLFRESFAASLICVDTTKNNLENFELDYKTQENISNTGLAYEKAGMHDSARYFYKSALDFIHSMANKYTARQWDWDAAAVVVYDNTGSLFGKLKQYDSAEFYLTNAISINSGRNYNMLGKVYSQLKLANIYIVNGRFSDAWTILGAEEETKRANTLKISPDDSLEWMDRRNEVFGKYYFGTGDYKNAAVFYHLHNQTQLAKWEKTEKNVLHSLEYGINQIGNQQYIGWLESDMKIKKQQRTILILIAIIGVGILAVIFYLLKRFQKKYNILRLSSSLTENQLKEKIKKDTANYVALLENTDDMLWSIDLNYNLLAFNYAYDQFTLLVTGRRPVVGEPAFLEETNAEFYNKILKYYKKVVNDGAFVVVDTGITVDGYCPDIELRFKPILDDNGVTVGISGSRKDITDYVNMNKAIDKNHDKLRSIAWAQSHNLRGPLSTIMGISQILSNEEDLPEEVKHEMLDGLKKRTDDMDKIVREIIALTNN